jgi:hypothetical protein
MSPFELDPGLLAVDLAKLMTTGASPAQLPRLSHLAELALVKTAAFGTSDVDIAIAITKVVADIADSMGDGPAAEATRLLFGLESRTRGLRLEDRRALAADAIGIATETWRKKWEGPIVKNLAVELYRQEQEARVIVHIRPGRRRGTEQLADLAQGTGGKDLHRREDEARLFALAYQLRAEMFGAMRAGAEAPDSQAWLEHANESLWLFAQFADSLATFATDYGTSIVMAGNEVTAREAAALLGFKPPISDDDLTLLRVVLRTSGADSRQSYLDALQARDDLGSIALMRRWHDAVAP